jgi:hypothetical protein
MYLGIVIGRWVISMYSRESAWCVVCGVVVCQMFSLSLSCEERQQRKTARDSGRHWNTITHQNLCPFLLTS